MQAIELIQELLKTGPRTHAVDIDKLPVWIAKSVDVFALRLNKEMRLYLVKPLKELAFEQITNILEQVQKRLGGITLLVADDVNPRFRALFVKNNVPFVYRDKSIFAPALGLKLFDYKAHRKIENVNIENEITPFELKLLAGYLTGFIVQEGFNLNQLEEILAHNKYQCAKSKLAQAVNQLIKLGYLTVTGSGPNRLVKFKNREEVWDQLKDQDVKRFHKTVKGYYIDNVDHVVSGETALAHYSDLVEPKINYLALTNKELKALEQNGKPVGQFGEPEFMFDVMKEPASLFAVDEKYINPVELYFLLKNESDERVQLSIEQMLESKGLKA